MPTVDPRTLIRRFVGDLYSEGNLDVVDEIIHPRPRSKRAGSAWAQGRAGVKQFIAAVRQSFPDLKREILDIVVEDEKIVLYSTFTATHTGEGGWIPYAPTGVPIRMTGVATFLIEDDQIIEEPWSSWNYADIFHPIVKATIERYVETVWNQGDVDQAHLFVDQNYTRHDDGLPHPVQTLDALKVWVDTSRATFPDLHITVEEILIGGQDHTQAAVRCGSSGQRGVVADRALGSKPVSSSGVSFVQLAHGKIVSEWVHWDNPG